MVWTNLWKVAGAFIHPNGKRPILHLMFHNNKWCFVTIEWVNFDLVESLCEVDCWEESGLNVANIYNKMIYVRKKELILGSCFFDFSAVVTHPNLAIAFISYSIFFTGSLSTFTSLSIVDIFCSFTVRGLWPMVMMCLYFSFPPVRYHPRPHADASVYKLNSCSKLG